MIRLVMQLSAFSMLVFGLVTVQLAHAAVSDPQIGGLPVTFWATAALTVGMAITTGYTRGLQKRISALEYDTRNLQTQISGVREMIRGDYPHRNEVADQLGELKDMVRSLHKRMDDIIITRSKGG